MMRVNKKQKDGVFTLRLSYLQQSNYLEASSTATAHATVAPTIGLLPIYMVQQITSKQ